MKPENLVKLRQARNLLNDIIHDETTKTPTKSLIQVSDFNYIGSATLPIKVGEWSTSYAVGVLAARGDHRVCFFIVM